MASRVLINYRLLKDGDVNEFTDHVIAKMTGNTDFPSPPYTMAQLKNANNAFLKALQTAKEGKNQDTQDKKNKKKTLTDMLHDIAQYVNITAKGNELMLKGSGFTMADPPSPVGVLPAPKIVTIKTKDISGQIEVKQERQKKAKIYIVLYTPEDPAPENDNDWIRVASTASLIRIKDLQSGQKLWVKAGAKATKQEIHFSSKQSIFVQ